MRLALLPQSLSPQRCASTGRLAQARATSMARDCVDLTNESKGITLVSFDIDGTLIRSSGKDSNKLHREAFSAGFRDVFGLDTHIDVVPHHGGTDPLIALKVLQHHGLSREQALGGLEQLQVAMVRHFEAHTDRAGLGLELLPGVRELLQALQARQDVETCLVTGNLEPIAHGKMRALGLLELFSTPTFGGFGSDYCSGNTAEMWHDRAQFVKIARERGIQHFGAVRAAVHVGDTPMDVRAALAGGAAALGVTTGAYDRHALQEAAADEDAQLEQRVVVLEDLSDLDHVLSVLQL